MKKILELCLQKKIDLFCKTLLQTNRGFNYYVNWDNIKGYEKYSIEIHAIDTLIKIEDDTKFESEFKKLLKKLPTTTLLFPFLFGLAKVDREKLNKGKSELTIIQDEIDEADSLDYTFKSDVNKLQDEEIEKYYGFFVRMGLKNLYQNIIEKSTTDYIVGVLVGLDSNGRKNRGGGAFEFACLPIFEQVCQKYKLCLLFQKQFKVLRNEGFNISKDIEERKADFIVLSRDRTKAINFEVNFYNGGGSKPEEIIDSYINRQNELEESGIAFSLVTDGKGCWQNANRQLEKGFEKIKYLQNFNMFKHGMLEEIIIKEFK